MKYFINKYKFELVLFLLVIGTFWQMLRPGIFTMQDLHIFRLYEFDKCIQEMVFPCRWAPDAGRMYGEPMFNFYGQLAYVPSEIFHLLGGSFLDSIKFGFIFSLVVSGWGMFWLAKYFWKSNWSGLLSAVFYVYAPYRAVDVWVRGALPEAMGFVFYPLIVLFLLKFFDSDKWKYGLLVSLFTSMLITTHNLSVYMFLFIIVPLLLFKLIESKNNKIIYKLFGLGVFSLLLSMWYWWPILKESQFIKLNNIAEGYFYFEKHWVTLRQLLISRVWGYSASEWGDKEQLSLSIGQWQWAVSLLIGGLVFYQILKTKFRLFRSKFMYSNEVNVLFWLFIGLLGLFLTHGKSNFIWQLIPGMEYIQFPWRWLGPALFSLSIAIGYLGYKFEQYRFGKYVFIIMMFGVIVWNIGFFKPDIWRDISGKEQFSGQLWQEQISSSLGDYWPVYGKEMPKSAASETPDFLSGEGKIFQFDKHSSSANLKFQVDSESARLVLPIVHFPGWEVENNSKIKLEFDEAFGQIAFAVPRGTFNLKLVFSNTEPRNTGNIVSLIVLLGWISIYSYVIRMKK